jgi:hypothetical protein
MELVQHILVTMIAAGAAGVVVWRVATAGRAGGGGPPCASCGSGADHAPTESRTGAAPRE